MIPESQRSRSLLALCLMYQWLIASCEALRGRGRLAEIRITENQGQWEEGQQGQHWREMKEIEIANSQMDPKCGPNGRYAGPQEHPPQPAIAAPEAPERCQQN